MKDDHPSMCRMQGYSERCRFGHIYLEDTLTWKQYKGNFLAWMVIELCELAKFGKKDWNFWGPESLRGVWLRLQSSSFTISSWVTQSISLAWWLLLPFLLLNSVIKIYCFKFIEYWVSDCHVLCSIFCCSKTRLLRLIYRTHCFFLLFIHLN